MKRTSKKDGFTLVEIIVVIAIMGVVSTIGAQMFFSMTDVWNRTRERSDLDKRADYVLREIAKDLAAMPSPRLSGAPLVGEMRKSKGRVELAEDKLTFPSLTQNPDDSRTLKLVTYEVVGRAEGSGGTLTRDEVALGSEAQQGIGIQSGVLRFAVEYCDEAEKWTQSWSRADLPKAVRVSLTLIGPARNGEVARKAVFPIHVN